MEAILKVNLFLTLMTVAFSILVLVYWFPGYKSWSMCTPHDLLLMGICASFLSSVGDNIFWGITWFSKLKHWSTSQWWFDTGPYVNLVFRHSIKIFAAVCHLEAVRRSQRVNTIFESTVVLLLLFVVLFALLVCN